MAAPLGKLTIIIGAGLIGSALSKEGRLSNVTDFFSGALKIFTKHLQQDNRDTRSTSKPQTDSLLAQVNNLRQELQLLASSRSVTIVTGSRSGSGTHGVIAVIIVGVAGYGFLWWKGWKLSDMMFVTQRGLSDARAAVAKKLEEVSSSITAASRHLSSRIDCVDCNLDECKELSDATKDEVRRLHGELSGFHVEVESVHRVVQDLQTKLGRIEGKQDFVADGLYKLCGFAYELEQSRIQEHIEASSSTRRPRVELPQNILLNRVNALPSVTLEPLSGSASAAPKVQQTSTSTTDSGVQDIQETPNAIRGSTSRSNSLIAGSAEVMDSNASTEEPSLSGWKLPSFSFLTRTRSGAR